ncbi:hypothetical protein T484DRAFT_1834536 [Baffinella frigidus]|nr:hypothetical protein T484DRAFT_1834536 [Cryptophyta sp. CCMP2293]
MAAARFLLALVVAVRLLPVPTMPGPSARTSAPSTQLFVEVLRCRGGGKASGPEAEAGRKERFEGYLKDVAKEESGVQNGDWLLGRNMYSEASWADAGLGGGGASLESMGSVPTNHLAATGAFTDTVHLNELY